MTGQIFSDVTSFLLREFTQEDNCLLTAELTVVMNTVPTAVINGTFAQLLCAKVQLTCKWNTDKVTFYINPACSDVK
jgi:hypothetical protein